MIDEVIEVVSAELPVDERLVIRKHRLAAENAGDDGKRICVAMSWQDGSGSIRRR